MGFPRFALAALLIGLVTLWADSDLSAVFFAIGGGSPVGASFAFRALAWAFMFGAVLVATPGPRSWPNALICALVLVVGLFVSWDLAALAVQATGITDLLFYWIATLSMFAIVLWPTWRWYTSVISKKSNVAP